MAERADLVFHNKAIDGTAMKRLISRLIDHFGMANTSHILVFPGNVLNGELTIIQRRILRRLRSKKRSIKRKIYPRRSED